MSAKRIGSLALAVLVAIGVIVAVISSVSNSHTGAPNAAVRGVIGSEKLAFFQDPAVLAEFAKHKMSLSVDTVGSRKIATSTDLTPYDFAFPAGITAAQKIQNDHKVSTVYQPFYSPMALATFQPIVDILSQAGVVHKSGDSYFLDVKAYLDLVAKGTRWNQLPGSSAYPASKSVLITSTDVRSSNSAAMYLAIASYVLNGGDIVQSADQGNSLLPAVSPLFLRQGYTETSSDGPFEDYLSIGIGKAPMVMIYESQFLAKKAAADPAIRPDMVLMYPDPTILSKHTLIPLKPAGKQVGELLGSDPVLIRLEVKYGFRTSDSSAFSSFLQQHNVPQPPTLVNVIDPPTYESLENMIVGIEKQYTTPPPTTEGDK